MTEITAKHLPKPALDSTTDQKIRVLHVDDDEDFLIISKRHLQQHGFFKIENALSVQQALKKNEQNQYDVIKHDGLEFLKELRNKENNTPFILFTAEYRDEIENKALNLGAYSYFPKYKNELVYIELSQCLKNCYQN